MNLCVCMCVCMSVSVSLPPSICLCVCVCLSVFECASLFVLHGFCVPTVTMVMAMMATSTTTSMCDQASFVAAVAFHLACFQSFLAETVS